MVCITSAFLGIAYACHVDCKNEIHLANELLTPTNVSIGKMHIIQ